MLNSMLQTMCKFSTSYASIQQMAPLSVMTPVCTANQEFLGIILLMEATFPIPRQDQYNVTEDRQKNTTAIVYV